MSIHLESVPIPFGTNPVNYFRDMAGSDAKVVKINTKVTDFDLMQDIIANSTLGFKSKRDLMNFQDRCLMYFEYNGSTVDISFIGNFDDYEVHNFVRNLNREFIKIVESRHNSTGANGIQADSEDMLHEHKKKHDSNNKSKKYNIEPIKIRESYLDNNENTSDIDDEEDIVIEETLLSEKKFIVSSNLKDKTIIDKVLDDSYGGYSSKDDLEKFQEIGEILLNKTLNGTYDFLFIGDYDEDEAKNYVENITEEYALIVQEQTYLKVMEKIKKQNLSLESEVIDANDSIILTLNIK